MPNLDLHRIPAYFHNYVSHVSETDLHKAFILHQQALMNVLINMPEEKWDYRYAPEKWTVKEMVQHLIDAERIFSYRALTFARKDQTSLPGFEEDDYVVAAQAHLRSSEDLLRELEVVQKSTALLFYSFTEEQLEASGTASGKQVYVRGIGFIIIGHTLHHMTVLKERYGI